MADIQVRASASTPRVRPQEGPKQTAQAEKLPQAAGDTLVRDGAPAGNPFKDSQTYVKAVEVAETTLRGARGKLSEAQRNQAAVDQTTAKAVADTRAARDAKHAEAIKPLTAAQQALTTRKAELQAPIDDTTGKLANGRDELETATYPNKKQLDAARANAHAVVAQSGQALQAAQGRLQGVESQIGQNQNSLAANRSALSQQKSDLAVTQSNLAVSMNALSAAKWNAPGEYDWAQMQSLYRSVSADYTAGEREVGPLVADAGQVRKLDHRHRRQLVADPQDFVAADA